MPPEGPGERILATVLFTDIVDSTAILQRVGDAAWRDMLATHNRLLRDDLNQFRGREIATTGDGFLAVFDGATRAVRCGLAMTRSAQRAGLAIRVGLHTGEVEMEGPNARGVAVHAAARVMSFATASEVLVSWTTRDLLEGSGLTLEDAGTHELKGLDGERQPVQARPAGDLTRDRSGGTTDETRIDRWLCAVRLVKTRPLATRLCEAGHVRREWIAGEAVDEGSRRRSGGGAASRIASASSRSCDRSSRASGLPSPRPATWTTARRWCGRSGPGIMAVRGEGRPSKRLRRELERLRRAGPG